MACGAADPVSEAEDLVAGWRQAIERLGAVPRALGRWRGGRNELTGECRAFRGTPDAKVRVCRPADPEATGLIERAHDDPERPSCPSAGSVHRWYVADE